MPRGIKAYLLLYFRAKRVKNTAIINKDVSQKALLSAYQDEIRKLREQLQKQGSSVGEEQLEELEKNMKVAQMERVRQHHHRLFYIMSLNRLKLCLN